MPTTLTKPSLTFIHLESPINASNSHEFQQQLHTKISDAETSVVVVNMKKAEYVDSAGLMALVSGMNLARKLGKSLVICNISASVKMVFEITQLDEAFEIFEGEEALAANLAPELVGQLA